VNYIFTAIALPEEEKTNKRKYLDIAYKEDRTQRNGRGPFDSAVRSQSAMN